MNRELIATAIALSALIAGCSHKTPTPTAREPTPRIDTTAAQIDTTSAAHDDDAAAATPDPTVASVDTTTATATATTDSTAGKATVFDRILAKAKDQSATPDSLKATVEAAANAKVKMARRTAVHWLLFQFEPTSSGRTADDQQKLIDALKATGAFEAVEGDRMMKVQ